MSEVETGEFGGIIDAFLAAPTGSKVDALFYRLAHRDYPVLIIVALNGRRFGFSPHGLRILLRVLLNPHGLLDPSVVRRFSSLTRALTKIYATAQDLSPDRVLH